MPCTSSRPAPHLPTPPPPPPTTLAKSVHTHFSTHHLHTLQAGPTQCTSVITHSISASASVVWSLLRRFDSPQLYKHFIKSCHITSLNPSYPNTVGSLRHLCLVSGIPAVTSTERLEVLDDEKHVISFQVVGGEHRLKNYRSVTSLHTCSGAAGSTCVVESYVVDVPEGNSQEDTCMFVDTIVRCNLVSLGEAAEKIARGGTVDS